MSWEKPVTVKVEPRHVERAREWLSTEAFRNGQGEQARRLVLTDDGPPKRDLGGWCVEALADKLAALIAEVEGERDEEWSTASGSDGGEGHLRDRIAFAVAEERERAERIVREECEKASWPPASCTSVEERGIWIAGVKTAEAEILRRLAEPEAREKA